MNEKVCWFEVQMNEIGVICAAEQCIRNNITFDRFIIGQLSKKLIKLFGRDAKARFRIILHNDRQVKYLFPSLSENGYLIKKPTGKRPVIFWNESD